VKAEEMETIKARAEAATPGPWWLQMTTACCFVVQCGGRTSDAKYLAQMDGEPPATGDYMDCGEPYYDGAKDDGEFIAHARTDVPALVAEVERKTDDIVTLMGELAKRDAEIERLRAERQDLIDRVEMY
jgi:hypothetical protein